MAGQSAAKIGPKLMEVVKSSVIKPQNFKPKMMEQFGQDHNLLSYATSVPKNVGHVGGEKSYMLLGSYARLERALMRWTMNELVNKHGFTPVVVPNILYDRIINKCGFPTHSTRSQVYKISANSTESMLDENVTLAGDKTKTHSCMAGTSEFALVSVHIGDTLPLDQLPKKYCAQSRCYRAETSNVAHESGLYRVHYFNKVEMVAMTMPDDSVNMHEEFLSIQRDLFSQLNLSFQILDMPEDDLGLSAVKKYDIEAWMEARQLYGEISSTSNCHDYQSSRLNIRYSQMVKRGNQLDVDTGFVHTVNGTACSTIRTMIALIEQHQTSDGRVEIPSPLMPYMEGATHIPTDRDRKLLSNLNLLWLDDK